jgi:hypothetical protein
MPDAYLVGEAARISLRVADIDGATADPGTLKLKVKAPGGAVTTLTYGVDADVMRDGLGQFHADIVLPAAGQWAYRWELTAPNTGAAEGVIVVAKSRVI